jgi:hypothetical protein
MSTDPSRRIGVKSFRANGSVGSRVTYGGTSPIVKASPTPAGQRRAPLPPRHGRCPRTLHRFGRIVRSFGTVVFGPESDVANQSTGMRSCARASGSGAGFRPPAPVPSDRPQPSAQCAADRREARLRALPIREGRDGSLHRHDRFAVKTDSPVFGNPASDFCPINGYISYKQFSKRGGQRLFAGRGDVS